MDDLRCESRCSFETPWSRQAKAASAVLQLLDVHTHCTLPSGHSGNHLGPDDSTWPNELSKMSCYKCNLLLELYERTPKMPRDYWVMTELFVELHGHDYRNDWGARDKWVNLKGENKVDEIIGLKVEMVYTDSKGSLLVKWNRLRSSDFDHVQVAWWCPDVDFCRRTCVRRGNQVYLSILAADPGCTWFVAARAVNDVMVSQWQWEVVEVPAEKAAWNEIIGRPWQSGFYWFWSRGNWIPVEIHEDLIHMWFMDKGTIWLEAPVGRYVPMQKPAPVEDRIS